MIPGIEGWALEHADEYVSVIHPEGGQQTGTGGIGGAGFHTSGLGSIEGGLGI